MKCKYCNAPVTLEDEFCPYCGALNEPAREHLHHMRQYSADYEYTKRQVLENTRKQSKNHGRIISIGVLILVNAILIAGHFGMEDLRYFNEVRTINAHAEEYRRQLSEYESTENFRMINPYFNYNYLYEAKTLREFDSLAEMSNNYIRISRNIYYLISGADTYQTQGELLQQIGNQIYYFYQALGSKDKNPDYYAEQFSPVHLESMQKLEDRIHALLLGHCSLTQEDFEKLPDMESQDIMILIGRRMGIYE